MSMQLWSLTSPVGPWTVIAADGVVLVSGFESPQETAGRLPPGSSTPVQVAELGPISDAVKSYLDGQVDALDAILVNQPGGAAGETWSYAELATKAGKPGAARAAASACANNLVAPFVPCHRVVRSDGTMGGYYYGLSTKTWLLTHERN
jgi:methylated-DNA-[protein]-cysteine S-methyltransferase